MRLLDDAVAKATTEQQAQVHDYARMNSLFALGRGAEAVTLLQARAAAIPDDYEPRARLASALFRLQRFDEARVAIDDAIRLSYGPRRLRYLLLKADIDSSAAANVGLVAVLRGDVVGSQLSHAWSLDARPAGSLAMLKDSTAAMAVLTVDLVGDYVLTLKVTDASANSASATATLTAAISNTGPLSSTGPTRSFALGSVSTVDGPGGVTPPPASGGGALGLGWLIGLAAAVGLLARRRS